MTVVIDSLKGITFPSWTTAGRPLLPNVGQTGFNSSYNVFEFYDGAQWLPVGSGNKPRTTSSTSVSSPLSWNSDLYEQYTISAQAGNLTIGADTGSPINGQKMLFRIKDDGTAKTLSFTTGSSKAFRAMGVTLPTTTIASKTLYVGCMYNFSDDRWDIISTALET